MASMPSSLMCFDSDEEDKHEVSMADREERQISVDPKSVTTSNTFMNLCPPSQFRSNKQTTFPKQKFISASLPPSANSSPRASEDSFRGTKHASFWGMNSEVAPSVRKWSFLRHSSLGHTKSSRVSYRTCDYSDEFELGKTISRDDFKETESRMSSSPTSTEYNSFNSKSSSDEKFIRVEDKVYRVKKSNADDDRPFHCGAMCMFLPGLSKGKQVRKEISHGGYASDSESGGIVASTRVSLEKFECGSWSSSTMMDDDAASQVSLFFDLPSELIRSNGNDAMAPVSTAFVFNNDKAPGMTGALKKGTAPSFSRKSIDLSRHVRFSLSSQPSFAKSPSFASQPPNFLKSPSSSSIVISPRRQKVREDFDAYLEAST